jgi:hypothetical protein
MKTFFMGSRGVFILTPCISIGYDKSLEGGYWVSVSWLKWTFMVLRETEPWGE